MKPRSRAAGSIDEDYSPEPLDVPLKLWLARMANGISPSSVALAYADWLNHFVSSPAHQARLAASALRKSLAWVQYAEQVESGRCAPCIAPA